MARVSDILQHILRRKKEVSSCYVIISKCHMTPPEHAEGTLEAEPQVKFGDSRVKDSLV